MIAAEISPRRRCDRCGHEFRYHRRPTVDHIGSECQVASRRVPGSKRALACWCDGYVPK